METVNGQLPASLDPQEIEPQPQIQIREYLLQLLRTILNRRIGMPGAVLIGLLLLTLLIAAGYFLGYPLHGAAGPD